MTRRAGSQNGNVLFLILIAVALFAALGYAVTQVSRTDSGRNQDEDSLINAAELTQFPTAVSAGLLRLQISSKIAPQDFEFNPPSDLGNLTDPSVGVFMPQMNGYQFAAPQLMENDAQGRWFFNGDFEIFNLKTNAAGSFNGNEIIAFLPGVKQRICERVNRNLGLGMTPTVSDTNYYTHALSYMDHTYTPPAGEIVIGNAVLPELRAMPYGCFHETVNDVYIYFHVLMEL